MRMGEGVEWAAHCAVLLAALPEDACLPAARLAEYHGVPTPYLAKSLQALTRAGVVESTTGRHGGYRLARPASEITLLQVVQAIEGDQPAFRCTEIRRRGPSAVGARAYASTCGIAAAMWRAEDAWRQELSATTIADIARLVMDQAPRAALARGGVWLTGVVSRRGPPST
ncbi:MAG: RrF2 family transcriptional regulator [Acidimicrobiales bacterium]